MIDQFLMQSWAGLPLALIIILAGLGLRRIAYPMVPLLGTILSVGGFTLLIGASIAWYKSDHGIEPPGQLVDVGGYKVHLWCEGEGDGPTLVWLPGGYGQSLWSYQNHVSVREDIRSCLIDRRGLGWSDAGPVDLNPQPLAQELMTALHNTGEAGPFVIAGHSFGGFYANSVAALYPDDIAGLVLLDPTAPAWIDYFAFTGCGPQHPRPLYVFASLFGLTWVESLNPLMQDTVKAQTLGELWPAYIAQELRPRTFWKQAQSLSTPCQDLFSHARWPGQLQDIPLLLIVQAPAPVDAENDAMYPEEPFRQENYQLFRANIDDSVLKLSSQSRKLLAPEGAGHDFPTTEPEFTRDRVLEFMAGLGEAENNKADTPM